MAQHLPEIDEHDLTIPLRVRRAHAAARARRERELARAGSPFGLPRLHLPAFDTLPRHAPVAGVLAFVVVASLLGVPSVTLSREAAGPAARPQLVAALAPPDAEEPPALSLGRGGAGPRPAPSATATPGIGRRSQPVWYEVKPGDTLSSISVEYGLDVETLVNTNRLNENPDLLRPGQKVLILPVVGALHKVRPGDTIREIAKAYEVDPKVIVDLNGVTDADLLRVGQELVIPGAKTSLDLPEEREDVTRPKTEPDSEDVPVRADHREPVTEAPASPPAFERAASGDRLHFAWPVPGPITTYFRQAGPGYTAFGHTGVDIANQQGAVVRAAEAGKVVTAVRLANSYGWYIVLEHRRGYATLYGHLSRFLVGLGDEVVRGQPIGEVGNTGYSFGPHLHFEVRRNGGFENPLEYLD